MLGALRRVVLGQEHVAREQVVPGELVDDADRQPVLRDRRRPRRRGRTGPCPGGRPSCRGAARRTSPASIGLFTVPQCTCCSLDGSLHDELVVRRAAGVLPGAGRRAGPSAASDASPRAERLLVQGAGTQVPVDASGPNDAERFETERPLDLCGHDSLTPCGRPSRTSAQTPARTPGCQQMVKRIVPAESEASQPGLVGGPLTRLQGESGSADTRPPRYSYVARISIAARRRTHGRRPGSHAAPRRPTLPDRPPALSKESEIAGAHQGAGRWPAQRDAARERFGELVARQQRRAAPHRLPVPPRRARRRRGGAGRVRQGVHAHHDLSRGPAVRSVVHPDPGQRLPRPAQGALAPAALGAADVESVRRAAARAGGAADQRRGTPRSRRSAPRPSAPRSGGCRTASARSSRSATSPSRPPPKSAARWG